MSVGSKPGPYDGSATWTKGSGVCASTRLTVVRRPDAPAAGRHAIVAQVVGQAAADHGVDPGERGPIREQAIHHGAVIAAVVVVAVLVGIRPSGAMTGAVVVHRRDRGGPEGVRRDPRVRERDRRGRRPRHDRRVRRHLLPDLQVDVRMTVPGRDHQVRPHRQGQDGVPPHRLHQRRARSAARSAPRPRPCRTRSGPSSPPSTRTRPPSRSPSGSPTTLMTEAVDELGLDVDKWKSDYESEAVNSAFFTRRPRRRPMRSPTRRPSIIGPQGQDDRRARRPSEFDDAISQVS